MGRGRVEVGREWDYEAGRIGGVSLQELGGGDYVYVCLFTSHGTLRLEERKDVSVPFQ